MIPSITSFLPIAQTPGGLVTITGTGFTGTTAVKFGAVDALFFRVVSDTTIQAYPNFGGSNVISITNPDGTGSLDGFTLLITKIRLIDLPVLGRAVDPTDLTYIWDDVRSILTQSPISGFPFDSGGGGGGGGNIFTALGSPFKVRITDDNYSYDPDVNSVTIVDLRLLGKSDYEVSATDVSNDFENYASPATSTGTTSASDGVVTAQAAVNITGIGTGAQFTVKTLNNVPILIIQTALGTGYTIGDTFSIASLPGLTFTLQSIMGSTGNLIYDEINGGVTIVNYELTTLRHITIYADGVVSAALQAYLLSVQAKMATYDKVIAPVIYQPSGGSTYKGTVWPWRRTAIEIPSGWQECTDFRGKICVGQDPNDIYDPATNPNGLSQPTNTIVGNKTYAIQATDLPELETEDIFDAGGGSGGAAYQAGNAFFHRAVGVNVGSPNNPILMLPEARIVNWIEYVG